MIILRAGDEVPHESGIDRCPQCGYVGLDWGTLETYSEIVSYPAECPNCRLEFDEIYTISHRAIIQEAERMANGELRQRRVHLKTGQPKEWELRQKEDKWLPPVSGQ